MTYRRKDAYYRRAKGAGYRARSAYKLIELDERYHILRAGDRILDLGAWPGGWLQVAAERVGRSGAVVGVDCVAIEPLASPNVSVITGDIHDAVTLEKVRTALGGFADVVLSDLAPKLSGVRSTDAARAAELTRVALDILPTALRPTGRLLIKLFMGSEFQALETELRTRFVEVKTTRPDATRRGSAELYAFASGYRT